MSVRKEPLLGRFFKPDEKSTGVEITEVPDLDLNALIESVSPDRQVALPPELPVARQEDPSTKRSMVTMRVFPRPTQKAAKAAASGQLGPK